MPPRRVSAREGQVTPVDVKNMSVVRSVLFLIPTGESSSSLLFP
jgi:hypothetical protein